MPVSTQTPINNYTGNASTIAFPYTYKILVQDDLKVYLDGVLQTSGYAVTGVGVDGGGTVTFTVAPGAGLVVRLQRIVTLERNTDYVEGGQLASDTLDNDFDRLEMQIQDLDYQAFKEGSDGALNATGRRLKNVANPVDAQDVATKNWAETAGTSFVNQTNTKATEAAASAAAALANKNITDLNVTTSTTKATEAAASAAAALANKNTTDTNVTTSTTKATEAAASAAAALSNKNITDTKATEAAASAAAALANKNITDVNVTTSTTKATEAAASAAAAAASYDSFDDRYLGVKAVNPTTDNDGDALLEGAFYWNSVSKTLFVWSGTAWNSVSLNAQPLDATTTALAALDAAPGLVEQTGPDEFTKRPIGTGPFNAVVLDASAQLPAVSGALLTDLPTAASQILHVRDEKPSGTGGGYLVAGNQVRTLNTVVSNTITGASLATNEVTLPAGTYMVNARAPACGPGRHRIRLVNVTDAAVALLGSSAMADPYDVSSSSIAGIITITAAKAFNLTHYSQSPNASLVGLGMETNDTFVSVYAEMLIEKIG